MGIRYEDDKDGSGKVRDRTRAVESAVRPPVGTGALLHSDDAVHVLAGDDLSAAVQLRSSKDEKPELLASGTSDPLAELPPLPRKRGRPRIEERAETLMATKPWKAQEMSRASWYRRQREQRAKAENVHE